MANYRTIITEVGQTKLANAIASGPKVNFTTMAVGDSNGVGYDPSEQQLALVNQVYSGALDSVEVASGGVIVAEMTIPASSGGYHVREAALLDDVGAVIALVRIADRLKPLPTSGQADELTIRMRLDVGNVGAVTWTVDFAKKSTIAQQLRPDFRSVESIEDDPVANASPGQTWIVGLAPTGAWVGHENELAEWTGTGWAFAAPTRWMFVGLANKTDLRWDHEAQPPKWRNFRAADPRDATDTHSMVPPADLAEIFDRLPVTSDNLTPWLYVSDAGQAAQSVASGVLSPCTSMIKSAGNIDASAWTQSSAQFDCPPGLAGLWAVQSRTNFLGEEGEEKQIRKNGVEWTGNALAAQTGSSNVTSLFTIVPLAEGDRINLFYRHNSGSTKTSENCHAIFARLT